MRWEEKRRKRMNEVENGKWRKKTEMTAMRRMKTDERKECVGAGEERSETSRTKMKKGNEEDNEEYREKIKYHFRFLFFVSL